MCLSVCVWEGGVCVCICVCVITYVNTLDYSVRRYMGSLVYKLIQLTASSIWARKLAKLMCR